LVLICANALAGEATQADQKWLDAVSKMVAKGKTEVSTPSEVRATLLKEWSEKQGYAVNVTKTEAGFQIQVGKTVAKL
jgi:hypothetical protein